VGEDKNKIYSLGQS